MNQISNYPPFLCNANAVIANGQTTSDAIDLFGTTLVGIQMPATFTGSSISFEAATTLGGTYQPITNSGGNSISATAAGGKFISIDPSDIAGVQFIKIVSDSAEGAERTLELVTRPV